MNMQMHVIPVSSYNSETEKDIKKSYGLKYHLHKNFPTFAGVFVKSEVFWYLEVDQKKKKRSP